MPPFFSFFLVAIINRPSLLRVPSDSFLLLLLLLLSCAFITDSLAVCARIGSSIALATWRKWRFGVLLSLCKKDSAVRNFILNRCMDACMDQIVRGKKKKKENIWTVKKRKRCTTRINATRSPKTACLLVAAATATSLSFDR